MSIKDLSGCVFGKLTVLPKHYIEVVENARKISRKDTRDRNDYFVYWLCQCDCGSEPKFIKANYLIKKKRPTTNCGCEFKHRVFENHGMSHTKLYKIWSSMLERCYRVNFKHYDNYGGRGIIVCDEWQGFGGFTNFYNWSVDHGYEDGKGLSINRIDNDGNYCPENCEWADWETQANNKSCNIKLPIDGLMLTIAQISRKYNISRGRLSYAYLEYGLAGLLWRIENPDIGSFKAFKKQQQK